MRTLPWSFLTVIFLINEYWLLSILAINYVAGIFSYAIFGRVLTTDYWRCTKHCILLRTRTLLFGQNPWTGADSKFQDPHTLTRCIARRAAEHPDEEDRSCLLVALINNQPTSITHFTYPFCPLVCHASSFTQLHVLQHGHFNEIRAQLDIMQISPIGKTETTLVFPSLTT